jgi:hypothetical protein
MAIVFQCRRCGAMRGEPRPSGPVLCDRCWEEACEAESRRAELAARVPVGETIVGTQPAFCAWCNQPFLAANAGTRYCCGAHRSAAWRAAHREHAPAA